jgi:hypothetical protein
MLDLLIAGNSAHALVGQYGQQEQLSRMGENVRWGCAWGRVVLTSKSPASCLDNCPVMESSCQLAQHAKGVLCCLSCMQCQTESVYRDESLGTLNPIST